MTDLRARELRPCPFCGGVASLWDEGDAGDAKPWINISCQNADCHAKPEMWWHSQEEAIAAWNRRVSQAPAGEGPTMLKWAQDHGLRQPCGAAIEDFEVRDGYVHEARCQCQNDE